MTIQQLIDAGTKRIKKPLWPDSDYIELPGFDSNGDRYDTVRVVDDIESLYFKLKEIEDGKDNWISADPEPEKGDFELHIDHNNEVSFETASNHIVLFGPPKYRGKTIMEIARFDDGLKWLDYVIGQEWLYRGTKLMIERYLREDVIKRELEKII
jgi:hypothetical protein